MSFPRPGLFALSAALWIAVSIGLWYGLMRGLPARFDLDSSIGADEVVERPAPRVLHDAADLRQPRVCGVPPDELVVRTRDEQARGLG